MNASEMVGLIGKHGQMEVEKLQVAVVIRDVRQMFGRTDYLVTPTDGSGKTWVSADRVKVQ